MELIVLHGTSIILYGPSLFLFCFNDVMEVYMHMFRKVFHFSIECECFLYAVLYYRYFLLTYQKN